MRILGKFILFLMFISIPLNIFAINQCGLGATVVDNNNSFLSQTVAISTDGFSSTVNLGAITTGTLGCSNTGFAEVERQKIYIGQTYSNLEEEVAKGEGPYLESLLQLMGCSLDAKSDFVQLSQKNYEQLFVEQGNHEKRIEILLEGIKDIMQSPRLANQCPRIS